jgi:hypothetical protein
MMQRAPTPAWIAEAAARAEQRTRGGFHGHPTPLQQVNTLIAAIMDRKVTREALQRLAKEMSGGQP